MPGWTKHSICNTAFLTRFWAIKSAGSGFITFLVGRFWIDNPVVSSFLSSSDQTCELVPDSVSVSIQYPVLQYSHIITIIRYDMSIVGGYRMVENWILNVQFVPWFWTIKSECFVFLTVRASLFARTIVWCLLHTFLISDLRALPRNGVEFVWHVHRWWIPDGWKLNMKCPVRHLVLNYKIWLFCFSYSSGQFVCTDNRLVSPSHLSQIGFVSPSQNRCWIRSSIQYWNPVGIHVSRISTGFNMIPVTSYQMTSRTTLDAFYVLGVLFHYRKTVVIKMFRS